jgi:enoyl-CoA hydratase/carnithine racemase
VKQQLREISVTKQGHVTTIRMECPERLNGWSPTMTAEIVDAFADAQHDESVRVVIFTGSGPAFCAGGDATTIVERYVDHHDARRWAVEVALGHVKNVIPAVKEFDKPIIAAINGVTAGAGFGVAMMCDIRLAARSARLGNIYMRRGTVPSVAPYYLTRVVGLSQACRLIFADPVIDATEAERIGLVNRTVADEELEKAATELALRIAANPPETLRLAKRSLLLARDVDYRTFRHFSAAARLLLSSSSR